MSANYKGVYPLTKGLEAALDDALEVKRRGREKDVSDVMCKCAAGEAITKGAIGRVRLYRRQ